LTLYSAVVVALLRSLLSHFILWPGIQRTTSIANMSQH